MSSVWEAMSIRLETGALCVDLITLNFINNKIFLHGSSDFSSYSHVILVLWIIAHLQLDAESVTYLAANYTSQRFMNIDYLSVI